MKYRIVHEMRGYERRVLGCHYRIETWRWWWPVWVEERVLVKSLEEAEEMIEMMKNPVAKVVK